MRTRRSPRTTVLMLAGGLTAFAGQGTECTAQTGAESEQERLSLSASIEEARRSPFHAGSGGATGEASFSDMGFAGPAWYHPQDPGSQGEALFHGPPVAFTFVLAGVSHFVGVYLLLGCGYGYNSHGCVLGPALTVPAVALPAAASGVGVGRALVASTFGLAGGFGAFVAAAHITEAIDNANLLISALASSLVHAGMTTAILRRWDS